MPHVNVLESELAVLVLVDIQEKMLSAITTSPPESLLRKMTALVEAARLLEIPIIFTEQYPEGLGPTHRQLCDVLHGVSEPIRKTTCSCWRDEEFRNTLQRTEREHVILAGLETHVCIQQTALDLVRVDYVPFVPLDAVGSRNPIDMAAAVERMRRSGVEISTTEALIFELVERCDHPRFKEILKLVK
jgi:nicotinamidase-related amidase